MMLKKVRKILVVGAHFDDVEVGVGGTLLKHVEKGDDIHIAILEADEFRTGDPKTRLKEQLDAMKFYGIDEDNLILYDSVDNQADIISKLDKIKPDIIYTPYYKDTHQAHRRASKIAQSVARKKNITIIFFYCGSSIEFYPNMFSVIDFDRKNELINCHKTQIECEALKRSIRDKIESYWGALISEDENCYAEGLIVKKMIYEV
jgi:LmbE family N-acetylglucosaminyl deacetylase